MSHTLDRLDPARLRALAPRLPGGACYRIAFSGGADSSVLLHLAHAGGLAPLCALHVDHGLQADSARWARHCRQVCDALGVPLHVLRVTVPAGDGRGPEAAARDARYGALRSAMATGDLLLTAHHCNDQAETVLLRLLRGSGVDGLAAMRPLVVFSPGRLWRPMLTIARDALSAYAREQGLEWIDDPQNSDSRYTRSWLRSEVMPLLQSRYPALVRTLARSAQSAGEQSDLLQALGEADIGSDGRGDRRCLPVGALLALPPARQRNALRVWLRRCAVTMPDADCLYRIQDEVLAARSDAQPRLRLGTVELRRYRDSLYLCDPLPPAPEAGHCLDWRGTAKLVLPPGCGTLQATREPPLPLHVRFSRGGERLQPERSAHSRSLKNLFQEAGIPPWLRCRLPLVELDGLPAWVPGLPASADWRQFCEKHEWRARYVPETGPDRLDSKFRGGP